MIDGELKNIYRDWRRAEQKIYDLKKTREILVQRAEVVLRRLGILREERDTQYIDLRGQIIGIRDSSTYNSEVIVEVPEICIVRFALEKVKKEMKGLRNGIRSGSFSVGDMVDFKAKLTYIEREAKMGLTPA